MKTGKVVLYLGCANVLLCVCQGLLFRNIFGSKVDQDKVDQRRILYLHTHTAVMVHFVDPPPPPPRKSEPSFTTVGGGVSKTDVQHSYQYVV